MLLVFGGQRSELPRLPTRGQGRASIATGDDPTKLEGSDRLRVLLRAEAGRVGKIRTFSEDCPVDAGGLPLVWIEDVRPAESVALLVSLVGQPRDGATGGKRLDDGALAAIAFHADPSADAALERFVAPEPAARAPEAGRVLDRSGARRARLRDCCGGW